MARKRQHDELEGLYKSDLEFLIDEITVGALAYRNKDILKDTLIEGYSYEHIGKKYGCCGKLKNCHKCCVKNGWEEW